MDAACSLVSRVGMLSGFWSPVGGSWLLCFPPGLVLLSSAGTLRQGEVAVSHGKGGGPNQHWSRKLHHCANNKQVPVFENSHIHCSLAPDIMS
jgi:hypothetical protein